MDVEELVSKSLTLCVTLVHVHTCTYYKYSYYLDLAIVAIYSTSSYSEFGLELAS